MSTSVQTDRWRGVASEEVDEFSASVAGLLRKRSRHLLANLARPYRWQLVLAGALILIRSAAYLSVPYLIGLGIDRGIRPGKSGDVAALVEVGAALVGVLIVHA